MNKNHKLYIIENNNIPDTEIDMNFSEDTYYKHTLYRDDNTYEIKDYTDGVLKLSCDGWDIPCKWDTSNITVFNKSYQKLAFIAFCLCTHSYTRTDILNATDVFVRALKKKYIPDFKEFEFDVIKDQQIRNSGYLLVVDDGENEPLYDCAGMCQESNFIKNISKTEIALEDIAMMKKYTIVVDDLGCDYIDRMISDGIIDIRSHRVFCFYDWNKWEEIIG